MANYSYTVKKTPRLKTTYLNANQRRIAYVHSRGSNTNRSSILFCGGFRSNMQGLKALAFERFCTQRHLSYTRFDYSGHGESDGLFEQGDIGSWTQDALAVFDKIACESSKQGVIVIGSSMGAWIATLLARERGNHIAGLMTLAAAPDFTEKLLLPSLDKTQRATLKRGETLYIPSDYDDGSPYPISANLIENSKAYTVLDQPFSLAAPLRLIHGTGDKDVPHTLSSLLMDTIQSDDALLTLIKNADHRLSGKEELKVTTQILQSLFE